jgi:chromosome segregation ATPase
MITKEQLESRLAQLIREQKELQESYEQMGRNIHAYAGAIEDCNFWLEKLREEEVAIVEKKAK